MIIKSIKLINFRNHDSYFLECSDNTSLIIGKNGSGKTSVLEAIYIATRGKSFRATDPDILKKDKDYYRIEIEYLNSDKNIITYNGLVKTFNLSNQKLKRLTKKYQYPVVLFLPSDLNLVNNSPSKRREYFNRIFSEFDFLYHQDLLRYDKALKQRNELLKNPQASPETLFSWNLILAKYGAKITRKRRKYIKEINQQLTNTYRSISKNQDEIEIIYQTEVETESKYLKTLEENLKKDLILGHTSFGIHRDDFVFYFNHNITDGSASRGETRSIILALKFIEAELIYQKTNLKPIILLDDVFSELDQTRRKCLVNNFKDNQVIITSVEEVSNNL